MKKARQKIDEHIRKIVDEFVTNFKIDNQTPGTIKTYKRVLEDFFNYLCTTGDNKAKCHCQGTRTK